MGSPVGVALLISGALYFTMFKSQREANATAQTTLDAKLRENAELESYRPKLVDIERQLASLKQQLEIERKIVPDEKEVPGFMKMMNAEAAKAGSRTAPLHLQADGGEGVLHRSAFRGGTRWPVLLDAEFL